eukprot:3852712-Rhodomonas_salina.1
MSGTEMSGTKLSGTKIAYAYAMSGTEIGYGPTRKATGSRNFSAASAAPRCYPATGSYAMSAYAAACSTNNVATDPVPDVRLSASRISGSETAYGAARRRVGGFVVLTRGWAVLRWRMGCMRFAVQT